MGMPTIRTYSLVIVAMSLIRIPYFEQQKYALRWEWEFPSVMALAPADGHVSTESVGRENERLSTPGRARR